MTSTSPRAIGVRTGGNVANLVGSEGYDGQTGTLIFSGNGAPGPLGGSGRAGAQDGLSNAVYGAGGGYDPLLTSTICYDASRYGGIVIFEEYA